MSNKIVNAEVAEWLRRSAAVGVVRPLMMADDRWTPVHGGSINHSFTRADADKQVDADEICVMCCCERLARKNERCGLGVPPSAYFPVEKVMKMKERKIVYFEKPGEKNIGDTISAAFARLKGGDIKYVVVASHTGETALKAAEKMKGAGVGICAVTAHAGADPETVRRWDRNLPKLEKLEVSVFRGTHSLSGVERAVRKRWGTAGPVLLMGDTLRIFGEGMKVCVEICIMAADAGLIPAGKKVMAIAGTSSGADTCVIIKSAGAKNFFDQAVQEIICKPYSEGIKHEAG